MRHISLRSDARRRVQPNRPAVGRAHDRRRGHRAEPGLHDRQDPGDDRDKRAVRSHTTENELEFVITFSTPEDEVAAVKSDLILVVRTALDTEQRVLAESLLSNNEQPEAEGDGIGWK